MKKSYLLALLAILILAIACGGGGGGGGGGSASAGGSSGSFDTIRAEAANAADPSHQIDALNITVGQTIQFEVVGYKGNARTVLTSSAWTTTDNGSTVGSLTTDGLLSATASSASTFTASGKSGGVTYNINYQVKPVQATVTASLIDNNGAPAPNIRVKFFTAGGVQVGSATSAIDGTLSASVPTSAVQFNLDPATVSAAKYFRSFKLHGLRYTELESSCDAPLPPLTNGVTTAIGAVILDALKTGGLINPPPPPPDGCS